MTGLFILVVLAFISFFGFAIGAFIFAIADYKRNAFDVANWVLILIGLAPAILFGVISVRGWNHCEVCGNNSFLVDYCAECGNNLTAEVRCPKCKAVYSHDTNKKYCEQCGSKLENHADTTSD